MGEGDAKEQEEEVAWMTFDLPVVRVAVSKTLCERITGNLQLRYLKRKAETRTVNQAIELIRVKWHEYLCQFLVRPFHDQNLRPSEPSPTAGPPWSSHRGPGPDFGPL